ncbi:hypothetical protein [Paraglaciecola chathamensis]|uniref:Uncharacterized protein n=1 Tax=Paraglaciecola agarilytica NO2 TaxID=1125747 RepID=A0ABQ0IFK9_9ALTE|nr:hypothetical protein [Paraglaciecola agarilytica]GAC07724.1 hypothetical protein GAGA_4901 [Paraglaciecola agarilytica NO2]
MQELWLLLPLTVFILGSIWLAPNLKFDDKPEALKDELILTMYKASLQRLAFCCDC